MRHGPRCSRPIILQNFLIRHVSRTNKWNSLIFCILIQIHINQKLIKNFWGMGLVKNGCGQSVHETLKLTVSKEWFDGMNWFFACWWKFNKDKSSFNDFWVGLVKDKHHHLVHETCKSAKCVYELSWFFCMLTVML